MLRINGLFTRMVYKDANLRMPFGYLVDFNFLLPFLCLSWIVYCFGSLAIGDLISIFFSRSYNCLE